MAEEDAVRKPPTLQHRAEGVDQPASHPGGTLPRCTPPVRIHLLRYSQTSKEWRAAIQQHNHNHNHNKRESQHKTSPGAATEGW